MYISRSVVISCKFDFLSLLVVVLFSYMVSLLFRSSILCYPPGAWRMEEVHLQSIYSIKYSNNNIFYIIKSFPPCSFLCIYRFLSILCFVNALAAV